MRTLVIESCPTATRWCIEDGKTPQLTQSFRLWGHRHGKHGKWLWTDGSERLSAFEDEAISVRSLWEHLLDPEKTNRHDDAMLLIAATFSEIAIEGHLDRVVFIIPESLPQTSQNALITALSLRSRVSQRETYLLWRSVALALSEDSRGQDDSSRVILDYGHLVSEFSTLKIADSQGYRCPVRDFTSHRAKGLPHNDALYAWILKNYTCPKETNTKALENFHARAYTYLQNDLNFDPPAAWECVNGRYIERPVAHDDFAEPIPWDRIVQNVQGIIDRIPVTTNGRILWHGWPVYWNGEYAIKHHYESSELTEPDAMLRGGIEFAKRHRLKHPTYFEVIPGYGIWCQVTELGLPLEWRWEELIPQDEIPGTDTYKAKPIDRFQLNPKTLSFEMNIREGKSPMYRFVEQILPVQINKETPIVINSEIRPTGGGVKFSLRAKDDPDLFGQNAEVSLRWDRAEERPVSELKPPEQKEITYAHPFIITSTGSSAKRNKLISLANAFLQGDRSNTFLKRLDKLMIPSLGNGYEVPFGNRPIEGSLPEVLQNFVERLNDESHWHIRNLKGRDPNSSTILRLTGALFHYASEETQRHLSAEAIRSDFPLNSAQASSLYWANGRTIRDADELERYLIKAIKGWPNLDGMHYWLFWPFQKSLCCYGKSAKISRKTAYCVFKCASEMLAWIIQDHVPTQTGAFGKKNWKKWTLLAILFGLRIRELHPNFLSLESGPKKEHHLAVKLREQLLTPIILTTPIPPLASAGIQVGPKQSTLGELVLRFLEARATDSDIDLAGGIGLSS